MAQTTITVPDAQLNRLLDGFALAYNYDSAKLPSETKAQFLKRKTIEWWKASVISAESQTSAASAAVDVNTNLSIT